MDTKLDWGLLASQPLIGRRYPALNNGRVLFVVRNGQMEFPKSDTRVWSLSGIATVGWLNTAATHCRVNMPSLTSKDGIPCCAVIYFEVQLKTDATSRETAANTQEALYDSFVLIAKEHMLSLFKKHNYLDLLLLKDEVRSECAEEIRKAIAELTPYMPRKIVLDSVAAIESGLDDQLRRSHNADATAEQAKNEIEKRDELEKMQRKTRRDADEEEAARKIDIKRKEDAYELEAAAAHYRQKITLEAEEAKQKFDIEGRLADAAASRKERDAKTTVDILKSIPPNVSELELLASIFVTNPTLAAELFKRRIDKDRIKDEAYLELLKAHTMVLGRNIENDGFIKAIGGMEIGVQKFGINSSTGSNSEQHQADSDTGNQQSE
jgi:hypothetical protein